MFRAILKEPQIDYSTGKVVMQAVITEGNFADFYEKNKDVELKISINPFKDKRTFNQNAYFHVLIGKIASALRTSDIEVKNIILARYGQLERNTDGTITEMMIREGTPVETFEELHLRPTAETARINGDLYRKHHVIRGTHTYDTREMCRVIDGAISEAREVGLSDAEIMTTTEKQRLQAMAKECGERINV